MTTDVVALLLAQHEHIRQLFGDLECAPATARQEIFDDLRRFLAVHETAEELITHPRVRTLPGGNDVVDARLEEETASKKLLASLDGMSVHDEDFPTRLAELKLAVLDHAAAEEREEFPLLTDGLGDRQLELMAAAVRAAEAVAPTHPHPSAGSAMVTNLVAGPIASIVDRTRDAVRAVLDRGDRTS